MSYQEYYEQEEQKKPGAGRIVGLIVLVAAVVGIIAALIAGIVRSMYEEHTWEDLWKELFPEPGIVDLPDIGSPATPAPTPLPTSRPMADLDGEAPDILDTINPISDIAEGVAESIVGVENYASGFGSEEADVYQGSGSGFIVSSAGHILTNAHVVAEAERVVVTLLGGEEIEAEVLGTDNYMDLAVLKVEKEGLKALALGDSEQLRVGEFVIAVGNPLGRELEGSVTFGIVSARSRSITIDGITNSYIQTDAAINFGNSGGPLLNMRGEVIGINTAKSVYAGYDAYGNMINAEGLGFALPIHDVLDTMQMLITEGTVRRPALGITVITLTEEDAQHYDLSPGVLVYAIVKGGPAEEAGIKPDDVILRCDGATITTQEELTERIDAGNVGDAMVFTVLRDGEELEITATLGDLNALDYDEQIYSDFSQQAE